MDQASGAGVAASSSSSTNHRVASSPSGLHAQDEQILSAFGRLRLHSSQAAGPQRAASSALGTSNSGGPVGQGSTNPPAIPRLAAGRGRGRTLPAWITSGEHPAAVPGGLREQVAHERGARAGPAVPTSPSTQQSLQGGQQAGPKADTSLELGVPTKGKKKKKSRKKKKKQQAAETSPVTAGGADVLGSAVAESAHTCFPAPASDPSAGTRMAGCTAAAASQQVDPRWTAARSGLGTIPAAVPKGGLQEEEPSKSNATAQPQLYSSRPQQSAQSRQGESDPTGDKSKNYTYIKHKNQAAAEWGAHSVFSGFPAASPPATVASTRPPTARTSAAGGAGRGRERTLPAWMAPLGQATVQSAVPGGLQDTSTVLPSGGLQHQQLPQQGDSAWAHVPRATASNFHRAAAQEIDQGKESIQNNREAASINRPPQRPRQQQQQPMAGGGIAREPGRSKTNTTLERNLPPPKAERASRGTPAAAPRPALMLNRASAAKRSAAGLASAVYHQGGSTTEESGEPSDAFSQQKRSRDEEPAESLQTDAPCTSSSAFGQHTSSVADSMGVGGRMARLGAEPCSKKNKRTLAESKPPQTLVATRNRFKIVHHHAIPPHGQIVVVSRGQSSHSRRFTAVNECLATDRNTRHGQIVAAARGQSSHPGRFAAVDNRHAANTNANTNTNTNTKTNSSGGSRGCVPLPPKPLHRAATSETAAGSTLLVVIDGNEAVFAHCEAKGALSALGPLLAIQYFHSRGVDCMAFLPQELVDSFDPESANFVSFLRAKCSGAIVSVPAGANSRLFILKHAIDKKAFVVTNDRLHDLVGSSGTQATLGQTKAELRAYLSRHRVGFTFARDDFVPDPDAPLARMMLTQAASAKRAGTGASRTTGGRAPPGLPSFPLPHPPPGLSGRRDNPTPAMLQHGSR